MDVVAFIVGRVDSLVIPCGVEIEVWGNLSPTR
jgi:hypothetical protein